MPENDVEILHSIVFNFVLHVLQKQHSTMVVKRTTLQGKDEFLLIHTPSEEILMFFPKEVFDLLSSHIIKNALGQSKAYTGIEGYDLL